MKGKKIKRTILNGLIILILGIWVGIKFPDMAAQFGLAELLPIAHLEVAEPIDLCFTPPHQQCGTRIVKYLKQAKKSIYLQAYGLTHKEIMAALIAAKQRGVNVQLILDQSNLTDRYANLAQLSQVKIPIWIDKIAGIAHNKVIIIDEQVVVTDSFNFTQAADLRNAENILIVVSNKLAKQYLNNWHYRQTNSNPWVKKE